MIYSKRPFIYLHFPKTQSLDHILYSKSTTSNDNVFNSFEDGEQNQPLMSNSSMVSINLEFISSQINI